MIVAPTGGALGHRETWRRFWALIHGGMTLEAFERWLYADDTVESIVGSEEFFQLIDINYHDINASEEGARPW